MSRTVILFIVVAFLAVGFLVYKMVTSRVELSKADVERALRSFLDKTAGKWDWDDFVSVPIKDTVLDSIRERLRALDNGGDYPPTTDKGRTIIQQLLEELSRYAA
jgi:hypothetical protein